MGVRRWVGEGRTNGLGISRSPSSGPRGNLMGLARILYTLSATASSLELLYSAALAAILGTRFRAEGKQD